MIVKYSGRKVHTGVLLFISALESNTSNSLRLAIRAEGTDDLARTPDLLLVDLLQLLGKVLTVSRATVELERLAGLSTVLNTLVELLENRDIGLLEDGCPIQGTTTSGGGACIVHVVHTGGSKMTSEVMCFKNWMRYIPVLTNKGVERLSSLLDGLVEGFRRGVAICPENLVLGQEKSLDGTHELLSSK